MSELVFSSSAATLGEYETAHAIARRLSPRADHPSYNCDAVVSDPTGLYVADGVGKSQGAAAASQLVVWGAARLASEMDLRSLPMDQAVAAVQHRVLPRIDQYIGDYRREHGNGRAAAALGALFVAGDGLVAAVVGNPAVYWARGKQIARVGPDQSVLNGLTNTLAGNGRPGPNDELFDTETSERYPLEMTTDWVKALAVEPDDRLIIMTDGVSGEKHRPASLLPESLIMSNLILGRGHTGTEAFLTEQHAQYFLGLPRRYEVCNPMIDTPDGLRYYDPQPDDCSVGIMYVS